MRRGVSTPRVRPGDRLRNTRRRRGAKEQVETIAVLLMVPIGCTPGLGRYFRPGPSGVRLAKRPPDVPSGKPDKPDLTVKILAR